jgi:hypothetical protein
MRIHRINDTRTNASAPLQIYELPKGASGTPQPHVVVIDANATLAAVTTYYVEQPTGVRCMGGEGGSNCVCLRACVCVCVVCARALGSTVVCTATGSGCGAPRPRSS